MRYQLKALGSQGVVQLQVEAEDSDQARRQAEDQGCACSACAARGWPCDDAWRRST